MNTSQVQHFQKIVKQLLIIAKDSFKRSKGIIPRNIGQLRWILLNLSIKQEIQRRKVDKVVTIASFDELHAKDIEECAVFVGSCSEGFRTNNSRVLIDYDELLQVREVHWPKFNERLGLLRCKLGIVEDQVFEIRHYCFFLG